MASVFLILNEKKNGSFFLLAAMFLVHMQSIFFLLLCVR